jgi:hypothetical protein
MDVTNENSAGAIVEEQKNRPRKNYYFLNISLSH